MSQQAAYLTAQARTTVEMCIDALCFQATHVVDDDGGVYLRDSLPKLHQLRTDQRLRIEASYGAKELSPDALAEQLLELYGADAQSLMERVDPNEPTVIDTLTDVTAKIFKKEMKQRIHEWEGSFRAAYDREAGPHDKMRLRAIYELYKAVKTRVVSGPSVPLLGTALATGTPPAAAAPPVPSQQQQPRPIVAASAAPRSSSAVSLTATSQAASTTPHRAGQATDGRSTSNAGFATPSSGGGATANRAAAGVSPATPAVSTAASYRVASTPHGGSTAQPQAGSLADANSVPTLASLGLDSVMTAQTEKRSLKRQLHEFEEEFRQLNGRAPSKEDRRPFQREYHRYGELKTFLTALGKGD